jgi:hypothetical protein
MFTFSFASAKIYSRGNAEEVMIMSSQNNFSNRELQQMDIHKLRNLARQVGVASPTSKKKAQLIDEIVSIITGKASPELKNINRGRPAKNGGLFSARTTEPTISAFSTTFEEQANKNYVASPTEEYVINRKYSEINGVVTTIGDEVYLKKFKFADTLDDAKLGESVISKYKLKENDVVSYIKYNGKVTITKVNGKPVEIMGEIAVGGKVIELGKRNIVFIDSIDNKKEIIDALASNLKVILLPSNNLLTFEDGQVLMLEVNSSSDQETLNNFFASVDIALFYKKSGQNVAFVSDNWLNIISAIKQFEYNQAISIEKQVFYSIQKLVDNGITFVGIIPSSLKSVFTNLATSFDNIC